MMNEKVSIFLDNLLQVMVQDCLSIKLYFCELEVNYATIKLSNEKLK